MAIVTSIHVYNFHLIISYLEKGVEIVRFEDFRDRFRQLRKDYTKELYTSGSIQELTTYGHQLFGINDSSLKSFSLLETNPKFENDYLNDIKASQISLDYSYSGLYLLSEDNGIVEVNIRNPLRPKKVNRIVPKSFENIGNPTISNMITENKEILLSYRGFGASKIENHSLETQKETIYRSEDAQDVRYYPKYGLVLVADALEGLLLFDSVKSEVKKRIRLYEMDFPQEIRLFMGNVLVKGKHGLYIYNLKYDKLDKIWEGSIGALTTYYNYIFFSSKGKINLLSDSDTTRTHFQLKDKERLDIGINKYLR